MDWCEIFKTGIHTSANGTTKDWTVSDLDAIVSKFEKNKSTVPIVIGHPKTNNPAYGWVDKLKREGDRLFAKFTQVNAEFAEWVNKGLYKNRSIALYPDLTLRHIGFLGAMPPAVKGLAEFQFKENKSVFEEYAEEINMEIENVEVKELNEKLTKSEAQLNEYSEQISAKDVQIKELQQKLDEEQTAKRLAEHEQFAEEILKNGCITPAQKPYIVDFCEILSQQGQYNFAEGDEKEPLKAFKSLLKGIKQIEFSEIATKEKASDISNTIDFSDSKAIADAIISKKAEYLKEGKNIAENVILQELKGEK